ncbi:MAG: hypothetical protein CR217_18270 [Beijerinckiaceae bacterium]|nr:MAG: hypothetical protein CR217_18270 [Beijerinckiaceae bacterium]
MLFEESPGQTAGHCTLRASARTQFNQREEEQAAGDIRSSDPTPHPRAEVKGNAEPGRYNDFEVALGQRHEVAMAIPCQKRRASAEESPVLIEKGVEPLLAGAGEPKFTS